MSAWEIVHVSADPGGPADVTSRLEVPGGHLYRNIREAPRDHVTVSLVFVPDPPKEPE